MDEIGQIRKWVDGLQVLLTASTIKLDFISSCFRLLLYALKQSENVYEKNAFITDYLKLLVSYVCTFCSQHLKWGAENPAQSAESSHDICVRQQFDSSFRTALSTLSHLESVNVTGQYTASLKLSWTEHGGGVQCATHCYLTLGQ